MTSIDSVLTAVYMICGLVDVHIKILKLLLSAPGAYDASLGDLPLLHQMASCQLLQYFSVVMLYVHILHLHGTAPKLADTAQSRVGHACPSDTRVRCPDTGNYVMPHQHISVSPQQRS